MKKILKNPSYRSNIGYNGLDLSNVLGFSSSVAHILPVEWDFLQPDDKVKVSCRLKTRTMPLISAAMANIEENVRWFFVPMSQIFKPFEQTYNGIQDYGSDYYSAMISSNRISDLLPYISLNDLVYRLSQMLEHDNCELFFEACRLLECLGMPMQRILYLYSQNSTSNFRSHSVNLLPLLAYHKIWSDYFRDSDRIANDPQLYNADSWVDSLNHNNFFNAKLEKLLTLHNCPVQKDICNNISVSPIFGEASIGGDSSVTLKRVNDWLASVESVQMFPSNNDPKTTAINPSLTSNYTTTSQLRAAFASEKLLQITRRAKKHYDAQILAHFGCDVPMGVDGECIEVGHHTQPLYIGDVLSTADTLTESGGAMLGEVGGKGYGSENCGDFEFTAKTHGILMCVYYSRPHFKYYQHGIDKKLAYVRVSDFPRPEYENLGEQPVFNLNVNLQSTQSGNSTINGWQFRYTEVKSKYDRAFLGLSRTLKNWIVARSPYYKAVDDFYCKPTDINQIMVVGFDETNWRQSTEEDTADRMYLESNTMCNNDPLIHELALNYRKASKISTYGISKL